MVFYHFCKASLDGFLGGFFLKLLLEVFKKGKIKVTLGGFMDEMLNLSKQILEKLDSNEKKLIEIQEKLNDYDERFSSVINSHKENKNKVQEIFQLCDDLKHKMGRFLKYVRHNI